jgi:hypothetical protein
MAVAGAMATAMATTKIIHRRERNATSTWLRLGAPRLRTREPCPGGPPAPVEIFFEIGLVMAVACGIGVLAGLVLG